MIKEAEILFDDKFEAMKDLSGWNEEGGVVEFWGLPPLILFFNTSIGWFGRFVLSTECYRTRKLGYKNLNWPRCSARVTESLALTDGVSVESKHFIFQIMLKIVSL